MTQFKRGFSRWGTPLHTSRFVRRVAHTQNVNHTLGAPIMTQLYRGMIGHSREARTALLFMMILSQHLHGPAIHSGEITVSVNRLEAVNILAVLSYTLDEFCTLDCRSPGIESRQQNACQQARSDSYRAVSGQSS